MDDLVALDDGLQPLQRLILKSLAQHTNTRRQRTIASNRLLEIMLGRTAPPLESKLAVTKRNERDRYLEAYLALVELAQPFRTRYPLVNGVGNFGTIDGDPPVDSMFTRCALSPFGAAAARRVAPTLLVNGASAKSGACFFLPHHLGEVLAATTTLIENPRIGDEELAGLIPGPDFPTGGVISSPSSIRQIYLTGQGELRLRGNAKIVTDGSRAAVVVTEVPFSVWKSRIVREAAEGILDGALGDIASVSDESDQHSVRIVFQLRAGAAPERALAQLFARTSLETTLRVEMSASVDGAPRRVSQPTLLRAYARQLADSLMKPGDHEPTPERTAELELLRAAHDDARRTRLATTRD